MGRVIEKLQELVMASDYLETIAYACLGMIVVVLAVHILTRKLIFFKYIPGGVSLTLGTMYVLSHIEAFYDVENLDKVMYNLIAVGAGIVGLLFALILGIMAKERKPRRQIGFSRLKKKKKEGEQKPSNGTEAK